LGWIDTSRPNMAADGCLAKTIKWVLFFTNFLVFLLGVITLGFGVWILVDKPSFLSLFDEAKEALDKQDIADIPEDGFDIGLYAGAPIVLIVGALVVSIASFFGCFGALKENRCMLITYFIIVLSVLIMCIVGAILVSKGKLEKQIKEPLLQSMSSYKDDPETDYDKAYNQAWNEIQAELKCCGVNNVDDWTKLESIWKDGMNKPVGCCIYKKGQDEKLSDDEKMTCRKSQTGSDEYKEYYFEGCYTLFEASIEEHQNKIFTASIATVVCLFINLLFSFAMCTMVE